MVARRIPDSREELPQLINNTPSPHRITVPNDPRTFLGIPFPLPPMRTECKKPFSALTWEIIYLHLCIRNKREEQTSAARLIKIAGPQQSWMQKPVPGFSNPSLCSTCRDLAFRSASTCDVLSHAVLTCWAEFGQSLPQGSLVPVMAITAPRRVRLDAYT